MKITPSPLVSRLTGSAAGVTCASWRGINFARAKVIPANPRSVAQRVQRNRNTAKVWTWQDLQTKIRNAWAAAASGKPMSGFNLFGKQNKVDPMADAGLVLAPFNRYVDPVSDFAFTDAGGQVINLAWTDPAIASSTVEMFLIRQTALPALLMTRDDFPTSPDVQTQSLDADLETMDSDPVSTGGVYLCYAALYDPTANPATPDGINGLSKPYFLKLTVA